MESVFQDAVKHVGSSQGSAGNETLLQVYALYKIATVSNRPEGARPGMFDLKGKAKWSAWDRLGSEEGMNSDEAKRRYIQLAEERFGFRFGPEPQGLTTEPPQLSSSMRAGQPPKPKPERMVGVSMLASDFIDEEPASKLHELAIAGDSRQLEEFLASPEGKGTDLNARDSYGYTALHLATDRGHAPAVQALLAAGADRSIPDEDGHSALDLARLAEHEEIVALLA
ncbi:hypothetical protein JCM8115_006869 [Rhodotorula mucilaginosa]|uniref:ACB domain-containing protein n=1 Tax=Rhodotorula mucilaginosa TaxID=5537 RepID=A0A9P7B8E5_RHOMI|nr:hypothetical protein C6P46_002104 [Rhodotorula mucilaginosa]